METPAPTIEEFRRLYEAALAFKQQAPWEWMFDDEIFGVADPVKGDIGYASIMGRLGEHLALGLYLGTEGLDGYYRLANGDEPDNADILLEIPHLQASFEDREMLADQDREAIKALGLKFRGRQEWPLFRSYVPGFLPWFVSPAEARYLTVALEQALMVSSRLRDNPSLLESPQPDQFLVRVLRQQGWVDEWIEPDPLLIRVEPRIEEEQVTELRQKLAVEPMRLEVDLSGICRIRDKEDPRPYLGYHLMVVDSKNGFIIGTNVLVAKPSWDEMWFQAPVHVLQVVLRLGILPAEIAVRRERLAYFLGTICEQLGIRLQLVDRLPALDRAGQAFDRMR